MAATAQPDTIRHARCLVLRVLLRRGIALDQETAQLVVETVQAALQAGPPTRPPRRRSRGRRSGDADSDQLF
jgi:hypothetical protein